MEDRMVCLSQRVGTGVDRSSMASTGKALSEYIERQCFFSDAFCKENGFDTSGFAAYPTHGLWYKQAAAIAKHKAYLEALEKYCFVTFWHDDKVGYDLIEQGNSMLIFPYLSHPSLQVCICVDALAGKGEGVTVGSCCRESREEAAEGGMVEALLHRIALNSMRNGYKADNDVYEKRMVYLERHGKKAFDQRLGKQSGQCRNTIKIPKTAIDRAIKFNGIWTHCIHHVRLEGQPNFLNPGNIKVGYV